MKLECQVVALHLGNLISVRIEDVRNPNSFDTILIANDEDRKLDDRFQLVSQPCPPEPEPEF